MSGEEVPFIEKTKIRNEEIIPINDERTAKKNEILKLLDAKILILISYLNYQNIIKKWINLIKREIKNISFNIK